MSKTERVNVDELAVGAEKRVLSVNKQVKKQTIIFRTAVKTSPYLFRFLTKNHILQDYI